MKSKNSVSIICLLILQLLGSLVFGQLKNNDEQYRPLIHFSPAKNWINDPNGMVYNNGIYHLFFQYHPNSSVWGPMHWGHATSKDMIAWKRQPIAIYPDSLGTIFSGSAVVDKNNTSGFGKKGQAPLVAIFTQHDTIGEKAGTNNFQNQSIAYSLNDGKTWIKYTANPVIKNPGFRDFRDPKVMWFESQKKWVMSLSAKDNILFYSSPDLKNWTKESEFGAGRGAHGGGWECPDLVKFDDNGKSRWVLIVNLNPGGPNKGSGTQYFVGNFDGKTFSSDQKETRWLDYGPDNYAGVTWSNTGKRTLFIGWMSNWLYANQVPTETWRNAMTLPRELKLKHIGKDIFVTSLPANELSKRHLPSIVMENIKVVKSFDISSKAKQIKFPYRLNLYADQMNDFSLILSNDKGEEMIIGFDKKQQQYFMDRTKSGKINFEENFAARHFAPCLTNKTTLNISLVVDASSIEMFADDGLTVMTEIFFPTKPYNQIKIQSTDGLLIKKLEYIPLKSIWP